MNIFFNKKPVTEKPKKAIVTKKQKKSYRYLLNNKINPKDKPVVAQNKTEEWSYPYPKSCEKTFQIFLDRDLQDIEENFSDYEEDIRNQACFDDLAQLSDTMDFLWSYRCDLSDLQKSDQKNIDYVNCPLNLKFMKALAINMSYQNDDSYSSLPSEVLLSKLFVAFVDLASSFEEESFMPDQKIKLVDELIARHSDLLIAHKAKFLMHFLNSVNTDINDYSQFDNLLYELSLFENDDHYKLYSLALASIQYSENSEELINWLDDFTSQYPSYSMGWYIRSRYFWDQKNRFKAIQDLQVALSLDPNNSSYQLTRSRIDNADFSESIYDASLNLSLNDFILDL